MAKRSKTGEEKPLEKDVEKHFKAIVEDAGGEFLKFVSPGHAGVPDRIVLLPGGRIIFVEFKRPGEKPRLLQQKWGEKLERMGFEWKVIDRVTTKLL